MSELTERHRRLTIAVRAFMQIRPHLEDIHNLAYGKTATADQDLDTRTRRTQPEGYAHTTTGDPNAKQALRQLDHAILTTLAAVVACNNLLNPGHVDPRLRGTMLGDDQGHHAKTDLAKLLDAQQRRNLRGEYEPARIEPQPSVPGPAVTAPTVWAGKDKKKKRGWRH